MATHIFETPFDSSLLKSVHANINKDGFVQGILDHIVQGHASCSRSATNHKDYNQFTWHDGFLLSNNKLYIPDGSLRLQVLQDCHDSPMAEHYGVHTTLELMSQNYWWPDLCNYMEDYIRTCNIYYRSEIPRHRPYGLLHPLPILEGPWKSISVDFINDLSSSKGFDVILTVVDMYSKMTHFIPCTKSITSQETSNLVLREIFRLHGFPDDIISVQSPQFSSMFWKHLLKLIRISCKLSSSYHSETDSQTEHTNQTLEQYLRCFINYQQDDWVDFLHLAEFSHNNSVYSSIGFSPFFVNIGYHPR
jgi:hypothetical protein